MNDSPESKSPTSTETNNWQAECASLQKQVSTLLLGVFVVSGTLSVFLWRQSRIVGTQLENLKRSVVPAIQKFKLEQKPALDAFEVKLADYARTHPDFAQLLRNYNFQLPPPSATPPAPVPVPAAKAATPAAPQKK